MANKNTKRKRKAAHRKVGASTDTNNNGKFQPRLTEAQLKQVNQIRKDSRKLYGRAGS